MTSALPLRICLVDMNNGVPNQATRCFKRIVDAFRGRVIAKNPQLDVALTHVQPRNLGELADPHADLVLSSGGPGAPTDGYDDPWCTSYRKYLDQLIEANLAHPERAPKALLICHSFEIATLHFKVAHMNKRDTLKFGVMPAYVTEDGRRTDYFQPFADRLFAWEHRQWEAVWPDERVVKELGGSILASESREGKNDKGEAVLAMKFAAGVDGAQFHPEADKPGVMAWIGKPEHATKTQEAYGEIVYGRMMKTLANPSRLARTFALFVPGWLTHRFNEIATQRGLTPVTLPEPSVADFE